MKLKFLAPFYLFLFYCSNELGQQSLKDSSHLPKILFDPEKVESNILQLIKDTRDSIEVSLYGFDNEKIANALIEAHQKRGIQIRMSTEYDSESLSAWQQVIRAQIPVVLGNTSGIMHNKYFIFDDTYLITGSTNLTHGLFKHFNNTIIISNSTLVSEFQRDFNIQLSGGFGTSKDKVYSEEANRPQDEIWNLQEYDVGTFKITPYFTPYKKTIQTYRENHIGFPPCENSCVQTANAGSTECLDQECSDDGCYDASNGRTYFMHWHYDEGRYKCPNYDNAMNIILPLLRNAQESIFILAFSFRDFVVIDEIMKAKKERNLDIKIWIDYNQYRAGFKQMNKTYQALARETNFLKICRRPNGGLLHHKVMIIDDEIVVLGSMNFSRNAVNSNDENFLIIRNAASLAKSFKEEAKRIDQYSIHLPLERQDDNDKENVSIEGPSDL